MANRSKTSAAAASLARLRAKSLTPARRSEIARLAGKARMRSLTPKQRTALGKLGARQRAAKARKTT